jgi:hypothetical protein
MTMTAQVSPGELADAPCSVAECFEVASTIGTATVSVDPHVGAPRDFDIVTFGIPICVNHAYLLRQGCELLELGSGM